jgi:O-antigen ligase
MRLVRHLSFCYLLAIPVIAGLSTLELQIGGLNVSGYLWAMLLPVGLYLLVLTHMSSANSRMLVVLWPWLIWCGYIGASLLWSTPLTLRNLQEALQFSMPIVVGLLAACTFRSAQELRRLCVAFGMAAVLLVLFAVCYVLRILDPGLMEAHLRAAALSATLCGCVFLALFPRFTALALGGWCICLLVTTLTSSRMATLALLVVPVFHPYFKGRLLWKLSAAIAVAAVGLAVFYTPLFQHHFFESGAGSVSDLFAGNFKDLGRFEAWSLMWDKAWQQPWLGRGIGSAFDFVPTIWENMHQIHNDYLRIFYELGAVGLLVFATVAVWQIAALRRLISSTGGDDARTALAAALLGILAMLVTCLTDNTLLYNTFYTNPLFALLGAAYGVAWAECRENTALSRRATTGTPRRSLNARWTTPSRSAVGGARRAKRWHNPSR